MKRIFKSSVTRFAALCVCVAATGLAHAEGRGEQAVAAAAQNHQFAFVMFYRSNDAATQNMHRVLTTTLSGRDDATIVLAQIGDSSVAALVKKFDATRVPMPAVAVLAPNGAVCSVLPQRVSEKQLLACIVSPGQAKCLKALQDSKIVALCALPTTQAEIPVGVSQFTADKLYSDRTEVVTVRANDPAEAQFLNQLKVPTNQRTPVVALMAPPGVMIGVFNGSITYAELAAKLAAAGKCCDDESCKHHKSASGRQPPRR